MKEIILTTIGDLCADFLYYDRKEDSELSEEDLDASVASGEITIDEMVDAFRRYLEAAYH